jgi:hypothetical protein
MTNHARADVGVAVLASLAHLAVRLPANRSAHKRHALGLGIEADLERLLKLLASALRFVEVEASSIGWLGLWLLSVRPAAAFTSDSGWRATIWRSRKGPSLLMSGAGGEARTCSVRYGGAIDIAPYCSEGRSAIVILGYCFVASFATSAAR